MCVWQHPSGSAQIRWLVRQAADATNLSAETNPGARATTPRLLVQILHPRWLRAYFLKVLRKQAGSQQGGLRRSMFAVRLRRYLAPGRARALQLAGATAISFKFDLQVAKDVKEATHPRISSLRAPGI